MKRILVACVLLVGCSTDPIEDPPIGSEQAELAAECGAFCGGFGGIPCGGEVCGVCIDDPSDECSPETGGADCGGICVPGPKQKNCRGVCMSACVNGCVAGACGAACADACAEACAPPPPPEEGTMCGPYLCAPGTVGCNCACNNAQCVPEGMVCAAVCL